MALLLIIDDEVSLREFLRTVFTRQGHEVLTAPHLDQALDALAKRPVDLVILDAHFPDESGVDLIHRMRSAKNPVPVIVYSGNVSAQEEKEFRLAGASEILGKGGSVTPLVECVSKILGTSRNPVLPTAAVRMVLVTDDDSNVRRVLRHFLEARHFTVMEASSGREAVEAVRSHQGFSAAFLDVRMPGELDGIAALQEIRLLQPKLGVIMVSAEQDDYTVGRAIELGAAGYVVKPFDFLYLEMMLVSKIPTI